MYDYSVTGEVELFKMKGGWFYIRIPTDISDELLYRAVRSMIPVEAKVGSTVWNTSLMPMGDGTFFIAIKSEVRKREGIAMEDVITVEFSSR